VRELRQVKLERQCAPDAPEEVSIDRGEVAEEPALSPERLIRYREVLEQQPVRAAFDALLTAREVAVILRTRIRREMRMNG
jgi:hypothetical protein